MIETYLELLEVDYYEITFAFEGLADEHVWKRPADGLLSVGEIAGHIAYWEAVKFTGEAKDGKHDLTTCKIKSPLIDRRFYYYDSNLDTNPSDEHLAMTSQQVLAELLRVHKESVDYFKTLEVDAKTVAPGYPDCYTYGEFLRYAVFHVAYHTGQMYSARHLLGEKTPDN